MKKLVFVFFLIAGGFSVCAQPSFKAPNYKSIKKNIENSSSDFYYPKLMDRYQNGDSTLTREERRHLYYGYVFHPDYMPLDTSSYNKSLMETLSKEESFTTLDYNQLIDDANALLREDPFNIRALNTKLIVYAHKDNVTEYKKALQQRKVVLDAIVSSGDGLTKKTAYYVIKVAHEYDFMSCIGYENIGGSKIMGHYHYVQLGENKYGIEGLYFDITPVLKFMSKHNR